MTGVGGDDGAGPRLPAVAGHLGDVAEHRDGGSVLHPDPHELARAAGAQRGELAAHDRGDEGAGRLALDVDQLGAVGAVDAEGE